MSRTRGERERERWSRNGVSLTKARRFEFVSFVVSTRGCYHLAAIVIVSITRTLSEIDIDRTCRVAETDRTRTMPIEKSRMDLSLQKIILFFFFFYFLSDGRRVVQWIDIKYAIKIKNRKR